MPYETFREEELKNKIAQQYFEGFDCTKIIGNVDFCVLASENQSVLWAEAKKGTADIYKSITQLILTIGKARTFDKTLPPAFLGAFDAEKMGFIPYSEIQEIFYQTDFNWNVTPSNHDTREFRQVHEKVKNTIDSQILLFFYENEEDELREFIRINFVLGKSTSSKIQIDKNNFIIIYNKWLKTVKPTITINWEIAKKEGGIIDGDFYLADLLSLDNESIKEKLYVILKKDHYELDRILDKMGLFSTKSTFFKDQQKAHQQFWNKYQRPPREEYWDYIVERRDLLVPQDIRERKGSFFTPQIWVELSQAYLADVFGENWQDEYYIWDCAAGTGNLLTGLTNKRRIWASTLDRQDVDVMKDRIQNGANLLEDHVFQFDFLNDPFEKLPKGLQEIVNDPEKRKKLVIYINPPYAEASSYGTDSVPQVANETKVFHSFKNTVGAEAMSELFAQFFIRVYKEIPNAILASFSTPKFITSEKFNKFRNYFIATYQKGFICKSDTFDNVNGKFPIAFSIWSLENKQEIKQIETDVFLNDKEMKNYWKEGTKKFYVIPRSIADWRTTFYCFEGTPIGYMIIVGPSMQSNNNTFITNYPAESYKKKRMVANLTKDNLIEMSIYLSVRHCVSATWLNNRDQFLYPNKKWEKDREFQNDCLTFALFHGQNKISAKFGINHWIPFTEDEVDARDNFDSNFMVHFIAGKLKDESSNDMFEKKKTGKKAPLEFSAEAKAVFEAGRELWKYYHLTINNLEYWMPKGEINASLYDIREYFQGRNEKGKMQNKSEDEKYTELIKNLREKLQFLAKKIEPKVYEYGFLRR